VGDLQEHHPEREQIERFLRCETSPAENRAVVLHLLRGCRRPVARPNALQTIVAGPSQPKEKK
jgi:hypothetical protein